MTAFRLSGAKSTERPVLIGEEVRPRILNFVLYVFLGGGDELFEGNLGQFQEWSG